MKKTHLRVLCMVLLVVLFAVDAHAGGTIRSSGGQMGPVDQAIYDFLHWTGFW